jgi:hypothetical protein
VPGRVRHRRIAQYDTTVPREQPSLIKGRGTLVATAPPQAVSRLQPCVATDWEILLRPSPTLGAQQCVEKKLVRESGI